ncbi:hypothetical protein GQX74_014933 [Glossina fuscipes]|nr:hypothetical protein GQX74_014933 [Glossina fuscipes]
MAISPSMHAQPKTLGRTTAVRTARTTPLATGYIAAKAATTRSDIPRPKNVTQEKVRDATASSTRAYKESQTGIPEPKSKNVITTQILITGSAQVSTDTKKSTIDSGRSGTTGKTSGRTTEVRKAKTMPSTTGTKQPKLQQLGLISQSLSYRSKKGKVSDISANTSSNNRGPCVHHRPQQGQFSELASPSPNTFYGSSGVMEGTSDAAKQAYIWHNQADKWLPLHEGDRIPNRGSSSIGR